MNTYQLTVAGQEFLLSLEQAEEEAGVVEALGATPEYDYVELVMPLADYQLPI